MVGHTNFLWWFLNPLLAPLFIITIHLSECTERYAIGRCTYFYERFLVGLLFYRFSYIFCKINIMKVQKLNLFNADICSRNTIDNTSIYTQNRLLSIFSSTLVGYRQLRLQIGLTAYNEWIMMGTKIDQ